MEAGDPIAFELFKNAIFSIADEMALTVMRTTYSGVLKDNMDFSTAWPTPTASLVAQGLTLPGHLGSIPTALESIMRQFGDNMGPGDIFIMNDPFDGGMHCRTSSSSNRSMSTARASPSPPQSVIIPMSGSSPGVERLGLHGGLCRRAAHRADEDVGRASVMTRCSPSLRRTCACRSRFSAIYAPSSPPAISPSVSSWNWWGATARRQ